MIKNYSLIIITYFVAFIKPNIHLNVLLSLDVSDQGHETILNFTGGRCQHWSNSIAKFNFTRENVSTNEINLTMNTFL